MKLAGTVILYHCGEQILRNIQSYYDYVDKLFVFDNTETGSLPDGFFAAFPKVEYYYDFENKGIASRLNTAAAMALAQGYNWLLTMDQDSYFEDNDIARYLHGIAAYPAKEKVAMFGTLYEKRSGCRPEKKESPVVTDALITSGAILNLAVYGVVGGFDENLFIDHVDHEYCVRAAMKGYTLIRFENICLNHEIGKMVFRSSIKTLFLVKRKKHLHSPLRCYYMFRNMLYLEEKYKMLHPAFAKQLRRMVMAYVKRYIYYGRQTIKILQYLRAAIRDFKAHKMGRIAQEL